MNGVYKEWEKAISHLNKCPCAPLSLFSNFQNTIFYLGKGIRVALFANAIVRAINDTASHLPTIGC